MIVDLPEVLTERFKEHREEILNSRWYGAFGMYSAFLEYISKLNCSEETNEVLNQIQIHLKEVLKRYEEAN